MKAVAILALALSAAFVALASALPQQAVGVKVGKCLGVVYVRTSTDYAATGMEDYIECDTDSGNPITVTMPATPPQHARLEVWHAPQGTQTVTIDPNGQATAGLSLSFSGGISGRTLLWVDVDGPGPNGGYWRVTAL